MSSLKLARQYYVGQASCFNPLWQHIGLAFQTSLLVKVGDADFSDELYVTARLQTDGVAEDELLEYVRSRTERLYMLEGWAGIGKTTLLHKVFSTRMRTSEWRVVWIDVLTQLAEVPPETFVEDLLDLLSNGLRDEIEKSGKLKDWWRYFVQNAPDTLGTREMVLRTLEREALSADFLEVAEQLALKYLGGASDALSRVRLQTCFIEQQLGIRAVVVIDNSDQLPVATLSKLAKLGVQLAEGARGVHGSPKGRQTGAATVIMALRPMSAASLTFGTTPIWKGQVAPPRIQDVLGKRLSQFLNKYEGKILRSPQLRLPHSHRELSLSRAEDLPDEPLPILARRWVETLAHVLTEPEKPFGPVLARVQELLNFNTRMTLIVAAGYIASGHLDFEGLIRATKGAARLSARKAFAAMMLGTNSIYSTGARSRSSWMLNVFNDGTDSRGGVTLRLRILKLLHRAAELDQATDATALEATLTRLFGADREHVRHVTGYLETIGLVQNDEPGVLELTPGGECYLRVMVRDFEYLQHVAIDVHVDSRFLVECTDREESAFTRFKRVLLLGQWLRELEVEDLRTVSRNEAEREYRHWYGEDTISGTIASALENAAPHLPRGSVSESSWKELIESAVQLRRECEFGALNRAREINA